MTTEEARKIIRDRKQELGERLVILGHHYQSDQVIEFADYVGDSLELARKASKVDRADCIVFCGVYFMAESAAILAPEKAVFIPDAEAGCPLADMADPVRVAQAWDELGRSGIHALPVTYVNSSARIKAFCGERGGIVCTSGNSLKVFEWAFRQAGTIFFMPDMNLGANTARQMGIPDDEVVVWDPDRPAGGVPKQALARARVVLWKGWCPVHWPQFKSEDVKAIRQKHPGVRVVVHPESDPGTVKESDMSGSTARILEIVSAMAPGERLAIGTETNMVRRAARQNPSLEIVPLREAFCEDMAKITLPKLADVLLHLDRGDHRVTVKPDIAGPALLALERMLKV